MELKTKGDAKMEALSDARKTVSLQAVEDLQVQGRAVAANSLQLYGKRCFEPSGFVTAMETATEVALYWLLAEGYVELTDKALASEAERIAVEERSEANKADRLQAQAESVLRGQYL